MEALLSRNRQEAETKALALDKAGQELRDARVESATAAAIATARIAELERAATAASASSAAREAEHERALRELRERWVLDVANMERQARFHARPHTPAHKRARAPASRRAARGIARRVGDQRPTMCLAIICMVWSTRQGAKRAFCDCGFYPCCSQLAPPSRATSRPNQATDCRR